MPTTLPRKTTVPPRKRLKPTPSELPSGEGVSILSEAEPYTPPTHSRYPAPLLAEYHALIAKKWDRTMTEAEAKRLQEVKDEINTIDAQYPNIRAIQMQKLRDELRKIRAEIEALPDA